MRAWLVLAILAATATASSADVTVGPTAGMTVGLHYFPIYFGGATASLETAVDGRTTVGVTARLLIYKHVEEEDFGSWGFEQDLGGELRLSLWRHRTHDVNPFVAARASLALVERIPDDKDPTELITGYLIGGAVGLDLDVDSPITRVELAFDMPSFTTHDNPEDPDGELSLVVSGTLGRER